MFSSSQSTVDQLMHFLADKFTISFSVAHAVCDAKNKFTERNKFLETSERRASIALLSGRLVKH